MAPSQEFDEDQTNALNDNQTSCNDVGSFGCSISNQTDTNK